MTAEQFRLDETRQQKLPWKKWGPYLSEHQWGTVREDYSEGGDAWDYFTHDQARSRAYRWVEDGLAGISDDKQRLGFALAWWNGKDPILKERLFGLTNSESNHGEDVKEYYCYLDSTPWMALFADNMLEIAIELAMTDEDYADMVLKFLEHDTWITSSLVQLGGGAGMWDEEDGFFYDVLRLPDGQAQRLKVRSMVGLLPLCAATAFEWDLAVKFPEIGERFHWFMEARPELAACFHYPRKVGSTGRHLFAVLDEAKLRRVLAKMLDENEFLSPFGIRSLSRYHADHPFVMHVDGQEYRVSLSAGRVGHWHVRRQLELARADLDARQRPHYPGPAAVLPLLRRQFHRGMSYRVRTADEPLPGGRGTFAPAGKHFSERRKWPTTGLRRGGQVSGRSALARLPACSTSTSTAITGQASAQAIRPAGPGSSPAPCTCSPPLPPNRRWQSADWPRLKRPIRASARRPAAEAIVFPERRFKT